MNAAETSASSAIADWTPLAVVSRSCTTAEIETFISDVSTTSTNIAIARQDRGRWSPSTPAGHRDVASSLTGTKHLIPPGRQHHPARTCRHPAGPELAAKAGLCPASL
jgi:hypothetical protein